MSLSAQQMLALERVESGRYRSHQHCDNGSGSIYGGQLLGLALQAAAAEASPWPAHALSGYFLKATRVGEPLELRVRRSNDGRKFATRHVVASQRGQDVFELLASFHEPEPGVAYQPALTRALPAPEQLPTMAEFALANAPRISESLLPYYTREHAIELRPLEPEAFFFEPQQARDFYVRMPSARALDAQQSQGALALMSDYWLPSAAASLPSPDPERPRYRIVSLNHSFWLHAPARTDTHLLYQTETAWAGDGRALARGRIYDTERRLVASATQEFLLRLERA